MARYTEEENRRLQDEVKQLRAELDARAVPHVDHEMLNEAAVALYDAAHTAGYREGVAAEQHRQARQEAAALHDLARIVFLRTHTDDDAEARREADLARLILGRTPQVQGQCRVAIDLLDDALGRWKGRLDRAVLAEAEELNRQALEQLGGYR